MDRRPEQKFLQMTYRRGLPSGPVVKNAPRRTREKGLTSGQGNKGIPGGSAVKNPP